MAQTLLAKLEKLRRPEEGVLHLCLKHEGLKAHLIFVLEPPLSGAYLATQAPMPGASPHPSQAMLRKSMPSTIIGFRLAPGLWEISFSDGRILSVSYRRKVRGVWWSDEARLAGPLQTDLSALEMIEWDEFEQRRADHLIAAWRTKERRRIERQQVKLMQAMSGDDPAELRQLGERANALRHAVSRDESCWEVPQYDGSQATSITDGQAQTVSELVDRLFHRAQRAHRRIESTKQRLAALSKELEQLDDASPPPPREPKRSSRHRALPKGVRRFDLSDGHLFLLGRTALGNQAVTFRLARGRDLWFHLRDGPGSHVVLPLERGEAASDDLILAGAALALHYSSLRGERAEVRFAFRADLDAVPGQLGKALVRKERTVFVDPRAGATKEALAAFGLQLTSSD